MGAIPGYLYLGSLKKDKDHGTLLNDFKQRFEATPNSQRKELLARSLTVAQLAELMGLSNVLQGIYWMHCRAIDSGDEAAGALCRNALFEALAAEFSEAPSRPVGVSAHPQQQARGVLAGDHPNQESFESAPGASAHAPPEPGTGFSTSTEPPEPATAPAQPEPVEADQQTEPLTEPAKPTTPFALTGLMDPK